MEGVAGRTLPHIFSVDLMSLSFDAPSIQMHFAFIVPSLLWSCMWLLFLPLICLLVKDFELPCEGFSDFSHCLWKCKINSLLIQLITS